MKRKTIALLVASLFASGAFAQTAGEPAETSGSVSIGIRNSAVNANDPSKFNEYRDLDSGVNAGIEVRRRTETDYLNIYGENIGRDDQYLDLNGGRFGNYKFKFYMDDMRHNLGSGPGAMTPYNGAGGARLTGTLPNTNLGSWNQFDHSYKRRDVGGMLELQKASPWYTRVEYNEVTRKGTNVFAGSNGTSPGNGFMDLPAPIDYTTRNYFGEGGYAGKDSHFAANLLYSKFDNGYDTLRWQNGFFGNGMDSTVLPPDNQMYRLGANGNVRRLFMDSTLAARLTYSRLTNNVSVLQNILSTGGTNPATSPSDSSFRGDIRTTTFGLSLASHPVDKLDTKLYFNYFKQANESSEMVFRPTDATLQCGGTACTAELFHQKKSSFGADAGYRLTRENKLQGGIEYAKSERERVDFPKTSEQRYFGEWKNSSFDWLTGRARYQRINRNSTFDDTAFSAFAANPMDVFVRRYDLANLHQDQFKFVFDLTPMPLLDFGFEAIYKKNKYKDTTLGRTEDRRQEFYLSAGYGDPKAFRVFGFGDIEYTRYDSLHRYDKNANGGADPSQPPVVTDGTCTGNAPVVCTYNWNSQNKDKAWQVGIGADWAPVSYFKLKASAIYAQTNGTTDFTLQEGVPSAVVRPVNITNFDNTRRTTLNLRGIYDVSKEWELSAGYAYERYKYSDIGYDNTQYVTAATTSAGYVTGQYSFQPYTANIYYATAKYRF